jgi:hypothetical protein
LFVFCIKVWIVDGIYPENIARHIAQEHMSNTAMQVMAQCGGLRDIRAPK